MTNSPPPGNWGPPQPPYGQGQPLYGSGQWPPQQPGWGPPPAPPKNNGLKWLLIGVAVLLVIAISVGATLLFTQDGGNGTTQTASDSPSADGDIASADDTGPVSIITEDPTCDPWRPINDTLANVQENGWTERDFRLDAAQWTSEQRALHDEVAEAMRSAADQTVALAKLTPHRVMRELYEQSIAYWRAYADSIPNYTYQDNSLAVTASDTSGALLSICTAISYRSAAARAPLVPDLPEPSDVAAVQDPSSPARFLDSSGTEVCADWDTTSAAFEEDMKPRREIDSGLPASSWTAPQRAAMDAAAIRMNTFADDLLSLGRKSGNRTLDDFAALSAQYWRAFASSIPTYTSNDSYLSSTAAFAYLIVYNACRAENG